jgi:hypothetical protein
MPAEDQNLQYGCGAGRGAESENRGEYSQLLDGTHIIETRSWWEVTYFYMRNKNN